MPIREDRIILLLLHACQAHAEIKRNEACR